jgi:hypothetical protein
MNIELYEKKYLKYKKKYLEKKKLTGGGIFSDIKTYFCNWCGSSNRRLCYYCHKHPEIVEANGQSKKLDTIETEVLIP